MIDNIYDLIIRSAIKDVGWAPMTQIRLEVSFAIGEVTCCRLLGPVLHETLIPDGENEAAV